MRFFQYRATDINGRVVEGTFQAASTDAAIQALKGHGLTVVSLQERLANQPSSPQSPQPQAQKPAPVQRNTAPSLPQTNPVNPQPKISPVQQRPVHVNTINNPATDQVHTALGTDKDRFFIFAQLASAYRAGINPAEAFGDISRRCPGHFKQSLEEASQAAAEGISVSKVFDRYPDLYPESVGGMTRAGEEAGFLPDAFEEISLQAESAHKFKRWFFWVWFLAINALLSIPGMWIAMQSLLGMWDRIDKAGGTSADGNTMGMGEALGQYASVFGKQLIWPWGPITLLFWFGVYLLRRYFGSRMAKRFRHRLGLRYPIFGARAKHENLSRFSWTMSRVAKSGVAPARAWQLAAESVPNLVMRDNLASIGQQLRGSEKLSDLVHQSGMFPQEYAPMVATAEYTGDVTGAMDKLASISNGEFQSAQNYVKMRAGCWGALGCFVTSAIMFMILAYTLYHQLPAKILGGD